MTSSYFVADPHSATLAADPNWPVADDTREPAAAVDEAVGAAMAGEAPTLKPAPLEEAVTEACPMPEPVPVEEAEVMPDFGKLTKTEVLGYCVENDPAHESDYMGMTKAQLVTEAEAIWTELHGPIPA